MSSSFASFASSAAPAAGESPLDLLHDAGDLRVVVGDAGNLVLEIDQVQRHGFRAIPFEEKSLVEDADLEVVGRKPIMPIRAPLNFRTAWHTRAKESS